MNDDHSRPNVDPEVEKAVRDSVHEAGQSDKVTRILLAWISELSIGQTRLSESDESRQYFSKLREALDLKEEDLDYEA